MKRLPHHIFALLAIAATGLVACSKDSEAKPEATGLPGTWKLVSRQCYCPPAPTPNETVTFTATTYSIVANGQPTSNGTYVSTFVTPFCGGSPTAGLRFSPAGTSVREAIFTLKGNTLVLDYGGPCDAPVDTYERLL